jgi:two-component system response regulator RegA
VAKILIADDDDRYRERLAKALTARGLEVFPAANAEEALDLASAHALELAALDLRLPGGSGLDLLRALKQKRPNLRVVIVTGYGSIATATEAIREGALHYLTKPVDADDLLVAFATGIAPRPTPSDVPSLARVEWEHIQRVLSDCDGNISKAARLLRIERRSLQRKLAKYPVSR